DPIHWRTPTSPPPSTSARRPPTRGRSTETPARRRGRPPARRGGSPGREGRQVRRDRLRPPVVLHGGRGQHVDVLVAGRDDVAGLRVAEPEAVPGQEVEGRVRGDPALVDGVVGDAGGPGQRDVGDQLRRAVVLGEVERVLRQASRQLGDVGDLLAGGRERGAVLGPVDGVVRGADAVVVPPREQGAAGLVGDRLLLRAEQLCRPAEPDVLQVVRRRELLV